eukprot:5495599-Amphidinium_carterae.1
MSCVDGKRWKSSDLSAVSCNRMTPTHSITQTDMAMACCTKKRQVALFLFVLDPVGAESCCLWGGGGELTLAQCSGRLLQTDHRSLQRSLWRCSAYFLCALVWMQWRCCAHRHRWPSVINPRRRLPWTSSRSTCAIASATRLCLAMKRGPV